MVRYQCSQYHINSPLYPVAEQIGYAAEFAPNDTSKQKLDKLNAVMFGDPAQRAEASSLVGTLYGLSTLDLESPELSPQKRKERTLAVLVGAARKALPAQTSRDHFEDTHWIDPNKPRTD